MPTTSRSRTTIRSGRPRTADMRLPTHRPPTHPGEMLLEEFLKPLGVTQSDFAVRLGVSFPRLNEIIRKRRGVSPDTALRLQRVLGMRADFWLGLQLDWDLWYAMRSSSIKHIRRLQPIGRRRPADHHALTPVVKGYKKSGR